MKKLTIENIASLVSIGALIGGVFLAYGSLTSTVSAQGNDITELKSDRKIIWQTQQRVEDIAAYLGVPRHRGGHDAE